MARYNVPHATYDEFRNATLGNAYDMDGFDGAQCWDYVDLLYEQDNVGQYLYTGKNFGGNGYAKECWTYTQARALNGSGHFRAISGVTNIKRGDIIVFNGPYSSWYINTGHIGFADEDYNGTDTIRLVSQNFYGYHYVVETPAFLGAAFLGIFRYIPWETEPPTPTASSKKRKFPWAVAWAHWSNFKH